MLSSITRVKMHYITAQHTLIWLWFDISMYNTVIFKNVRNRNCYQSKNMNLEYTLDPKTAMTWISENSFTLADYQPGKMPTQTSSVWNTRNRSNLYRMNYAYVDVTKLLSTLPKLWNDHHHHHHLQSGGRFPDTPGVSAHLCFPPPPVPEKDFSDKWHRFFTGWISFLTPNVVVSNS